MIQITCTSCRKQLAIDEAFAGGVCRCHECGTIQTVPARLKQGAAADFLAQGGARTSRTLYKQRPRMSETGGSGTGLDELAEIVASSGSGSGLGSSGLAGGPPARASRPPTVATGPAGADEKKMVRLIAGVGGMIVVLLLVILAVLFVRYPGAGGAMATAPGAGSTPPRQPDAPPKPPAMFCDIPLDAGSVVFVLDRGDSTRNGFGHLREIALRAAHALGPNRKFQLVFWDNGTDAGAHPILLSFATPDNVGAIRRTTNDVFAFGQSDARPALERALEQKPDVIVLATGKAWTLDDSFVAMVEELRQKHDAAGVKIHTIATNPPGSSTTLKTIAENTGGQYRELTIAQLRKFSE